MTRDRKTQGRPKVLHFWRGARRHPKWDLGTPPDQRRTGRSWWLRFLRVTLIRTAMVLVLALLMLPVAADALVAVMGPKTSDGCRVISVVDGDTVRLHCPETGVDKARLTGFDTPEVFSPGCLRELAWGIRATWALRLELLRANRMDLRSGGIDLYDRPLVQLRLDGFDVGPRLIRNRIAVRYDGGARIDWCRRLGGGG